MLLFVTHCTDKWSSLWPTQLWHSRQPDRTENVRAEISNNDHNFHRGYIMCMYVCVCVCGKKTLRPVALTTDRLRSITSFTSRIQTDWSSKCALCYTIKQRLVDLFYDQIIKPVWTRRAAQTAPAIAIIHHVEERHAWLLSSLHLSSCGSPVTRTRIRVLFVLWNETGSNVWL